MAAPRLSTGLITTTYVNSLAQYVDEIRTGIIARGKRSSTTTLASAAQGVLRIDGVPIVGGRMYRIYTATWTVLSTVANDRATVGLTYTTDGSAAGTGSSLLRRWNSPSISSTSDGLSGYIAVAYTPTVDETLSVLLYHQRLAGSGDINMVGTPGFEVELYVEDCGIDTGDVGVDI